MPDEVSTSSWKDGIFLKVRDSTVLFNFEAVSGRVYPELLAIVL